MPKVAILVGSKSDLPVMEACEKYLAYFGVEYEMHVSSAHRNPEETAEFARKARENGFSALIAAAGMAAHLAGALAAHSTLPVIGVPLGGSALNGVDALYSTVQMPTGVPVATMAIGKAGAANAAIFCAQILSINSPDLQDKLAAFKKMGSRL
ncbi:MAG: 5-(carboxyamino)imidazole ribonucleotide mutase [bacterium]